LRRKAPVLLTIAIIIIGILGGAALIYLPGTDAPQARLSLHDADGIKSVSVGETAEYVIKVRNDGGTRGHFEITTEGEAEGWTSSISHDTLNLGSGDSQNIQLFVPPLSADAEPWIDVNVRATRADNVTVVGTTTYLKGTVEIRKVGSDTWEEYTSGTDIGEGDDIRTGENSYIQLTFGEQCSIFLYPNSQIHCTNSYHIDGDLTYWFTMVTGKGAFRVDLETPDDDFTLTLDDGGSVEVLNANIATFVAQEDGYVRVLRGTVTIQGPPTRGEEGIRADEQITAGYDSDGNSFDTAMISYSNTNVNAVLKGVGASMGFENPGNFIANGDLDGFVLRHAGTDEFYLFNGDATFVELDISVIGTEPFDLTYAQSTPDSKVFTFKNIDTAANTMFVRFQEDKTFISSTSDVTYDFEIQNSDGGIFTVTDVKLDANQGNSFKVIDFADIGKTDTSPVVFGIDRDGDNNIDETVDIKSGMTGDKLTDALEDDDEDEDEDENLIWYGLIVIFLILLCVFYYMFVLSGKGRRPRTKQDREEAFRRLREDLLRPKELGADQVGMDDESWDEISPEMGMYAPPEPTLPSTVPFSVPSTPMDEQVPPETTAPEEWKPEEAAVPKEVTDIREKIERSDFQTMEDYLKEEPGTLKYIEPEELRKKVKKQTDNMEEWWDEWNKELDEIMK